MSDNAPNTPREYAAWRIGKQDAEIERLRGALEKLAIIPSLPITNDVKVYADSAFEAILEHVEIARAALKEKS